MYAESVSRCRKIASPDNVVDLVAANIPEKIELEGDQVYVEHIQQGQQEAEQELGGILEEAEPVDSGEGIALPVPKLLQLGQEADLKDM